MRAVCEAVTTDRPGTFTLASGAIIHDADAILRMFTALTGRAATGAEVAALRAEVEAVRA